MSLVVLYSDRVAILGNPVAEKRNVVVIGRVFDDANPAIGRLTDYLAGGEQEKACFTVEDANKVVEELDLRTDEVMAIFFPKREGKA